jgi:pyrroloquinoline quinone biosynthesis protein B
MRIRVLGSAAGGGSPQWNCGCPVCTAVRSGAAPPRTQSSIAVSVDGRKWFLFNASPDVLKQVEALPHPQGDRAAPMAAVLLTDAELDHTLGLLLLREAPTLRLYATPATQKTLSDGSGLLRLLERYTRVEWQPVLPGEEFALADGLSCRAFDVPTTKRDRFGVGVDQGRVVGYRLTGEHTLVYLPGIQALTRDVRAEIQGCDCLLIDGTCWRDDELGPGAKTSREMGHLPVESSLAELKTLDVRRTIFVHMNNTNPILLDDSPERRAVGEAGMEVAMDGLEVKL